MKHQWEDVSARSVAEVCKYGWDKRRRCKLCGVVQSHQDEQLWMRIVRRRWLPLVGRCKGSKQNDAQGND